MSQVLPFEVKPKTLKRQYKRHNIVVTFVPSTKQWKWSVTVVNEMTYTDIAPTQVAAFKAAEKMIDSLLPPSKGSAA